MGNQPHNVGEIFDRLDDLAERQECVDLGTIVERFGQRSYGPCLMIPALLELSPVGAVPGVPTFLAATIAIVAVQMLFGRTHVWLPGFIARRGGSATKLRQALAKLRGLARFLDHHFHGRLKRLAHAPFTRLAAGLVIALCLTVPPLEFVPFASSAPMLAIAAFGLAVLVRDGALMIGALLISLAGLGFGLSWFGGGS